MKSASGKNYTYSLVDEPDEHRFAVVVYLHSKPLPSVDQTEIGRAYITQDVITHIQHSGQQATYVETLAKGVINTYEAATNKKQISEYTKDIDFDGEFMSQEMQTFLKEMAATETQAETAGFLQALGINVESALPTSNAMKALINQAAKVKHAQATSSPNYKSLMNELVAMKFSFKHAQIKEQTGKKVNPVSSYSPKSVSNVSKLSYLEEDEVKPVKRSVKRSKAIKVVKAHASFVETERKFRDD